MRRISPASDEIFQWGHKRSARRLDSAEYIEWHWRVCGRAHKCLCSYSSGQFQLMDLIEAWIKHLFFIVRRLRDSKIWQLYSFQVSDFVQNARFRKISNASNEKIYSFLWLQFSFYVLFFVLRNGLGMGLDCRVYLALPSIRKVLFHLCSVYIMRSLWSFLHSTW